MPATARICLDGINERSGSRPIDFLVNTHHHGDHTAGNVVFKPVTKKILAQVNCPRRRSRPPRVGREEREARRRRRSRSP